MQTPFQNEISINPILWISSDEYRATLLLSASILHSICHFYSRWGVHVCRVICVCEWIHYIFLPFTNIWFTQPSSNKNGHTVLNKAYFYSDKHQVLQVHKQSQAQTLSVFFSFFFDTVNIFSEAKTLYHLMWDFSLSDLCWQSCVLTEERRVWALILSLPGLCWGHENKGQFTDEHSNMVVNEQRYSKL